MYHFAITPTVTDARRNLAGRVRSLRAARFLTQEDLSDLAGVGRATVARIEAGQITPRMRTVRSLATALGVEPRDLVSDPGALWP
jgi:transcriptional regulator with XRE-family HTH domain